MENLQGYCPEDVAIMALYINNQTAAGSNDDLASKTTSTNDITKTLIKDTAATSKDYVPNDHTETVKRGKRSLESIRRRRAVKKRKRRINKGPDNEFSSKHKKRLIQSPYSPLPEGIVEEDLLSVTDQPTLNSSQNIRDLQQDKTGYARITSESKKHHNRALLLDPILIPVEEPVVSFDTGDLVHDSKCTKLVLEARHERNYALHIAQNYRDLAEKIQEEKRKVHDELESRVETVCNFWRNQVVEGQSRSGQILRAALFRSKANEDIV